MATLNTSWHGVPKGTPVRILRRFTDWAGNKCIVVEREDGVKLPHPFMDGGFIQATLPAEYVDA